MQGGKTSLTIIVNCLYTLGGGERWALEVVSRIRRDYDITIVNQVSNKDAISISMEGLKKQYDLRGVKIIDLKCAGIKMKAFGTDEYVMRILGPKSVGRLGEVIKKSDIVYYLSFNPFSWTWINLFCNLYGKKRIYGAHNVIGFRELDKNTGWLNIQKAVFRNLLRTLPNIHVTTDNVRQMLEKIGYKGKIFSIPNFLYFDVNWKEVGINRKEFIALFAGRFSTHVNGLDLLSEAIQKTLIKNPEIRFHFAGEGEDGEQIIKDLASRYPDNVYDLGFLADKKLRAEYAKSNLLLMPSRHAMFKLTILEAQAYGVPFIAFRQDDTKYIFTDEKQGRLARPYDINEFSSYISEYYTLWERDRDAYLKLKKYINRNIMKGYSAEGSIKKIRQMFTPGNLN